MIAFHKVSFGYGAQDIFNQVSFLIRERDKIGLIGRNGAGKTTLFELLMGHLTPNDGVVSKPKDLTLGYLPQYIPSSDSTTLWLEVKEAFKNITSLQERLDVLHSQLSDVQEDEKELNKKLDEIHQINDRLQYLGAQHVEEQMEQVMIGLGFKRSDFNRPTLEFSGGWRMRIELAKILLQKPNLLLLDEPTNHLDIESIQWLEDYLKVYDGAVVMVSHDSAFLNNVTNRTIEIVNGRIFDQDMPYFEFVEFRKAQIELQKQAYENQQKEIEQTERFIERFRYKATKSNQVQSRIKQLEKIEKIEIDEIDTRNINIVFPPALHSGSIVCELKGLTKTFGNHVVLNNIDLNIERGEKIALVGKNGEGKTTLVKILMQQLEYEGVAKLGYQVKIGYYAQNQDEVLDLNKTVVQTLEDIAPMEMRPKIRNILGYFLFSNDDVFKRVSVLSGGERARLLLAKLLLEPVNFLILDEPTNHLDASSKEILKKAIKQYDGTVLLVSHDRDFLDGLADKIVEINEGKIKQYDGNIWEFLKKKKAENLQLLFNRNSKNNKELVTEKKSNQLSYAEKKELDKKIRKLENQIDKTEKEIQELENQVKECEHKISSGDEKILSDYNWFLGYEKKKEELNMLYEQWDKFSDELNVLLDEKNNYL
ncbi:MAG TPA: ATP-binding cassette domain-containing protein [Bacteroidales bacterium]|jgi:ATP-binding cassette subfamily F protein 3|nr:ATP-binding cassette domain-containing protein [Bacteroidales bacterium]HOU97959.1 ATP-binding cassette domain-containing protein [Bacteroidales bacterium]